MLLLLRTDAKGLTEPHPTSKPAWFDHFSTVETGYQSHHFPTGAKHPCTAKTSQTTPQDLLTYQNGALMGSARFITSENHSKADMYDSIYLVD